MRSAVLFDLDGTVADTLETIAAVLNEGLAVIGEPTHAVAAVKDMVGEGVSVLCAKALAGDRQHRLPELLREVREAYRRDPMRHCRLYPGVRTLLDDLRAQGARLAILSNKPHELTVATVAGLGIALHFEQVLGHREEFPHKPDPTSARWLLAQLGVRPEQTLYVGDTAIDVATARQAALTSVAVTWGFRSRAELIACAPDHLVDHPAEVLPIFRAG